MYSLRANDMFFLTRKLLAFIVIVMLGGLGLKNLLEAGWLLDLLFYSCLLFRVVFGVFLLFGGFFRVF
jgi:hypothetical protein